MWHQKLTVGDSIKLRDKKSKDIFFGQVTDYTNDTVTIREYRSTRFLTFRLSVYTVYNLRGKRLSD